MVQPLHSLKCVYANVQSIFNKKKEIELYLDENKIDIMMFTECWINKDHSSSEYSFSEFQPPIVAKKNRGGTCIYVRNQISYIEVKPPYPIEDSCWVTVKTENNIERLYAVIYRSPNSPIENNQKLFENLKWAKENFKELVITGDFNLPTIVLETENAVSSYDNEFVDLLEELGLHQLVKVPTRYREGQAPSLLDLLITSDQNIIENLVYASPFGKSDHMSFEFQIRNAYTFRKNEKHRYNFKNMSKTDFITEMSTVDWSNVFTENNDLSASYQFFNDFVCDLFEKLAPKEQKSRIKHACWANRLIRKLSKDIRRAWDKYKYTKTEIDYQRYKEKLVKFDGAKEEVIRKYEVNIIANKKSNMKRYYKYVSQKNKYSDPRIVLNKDDAIITEEKECVDIFNDYFSSVYTRGPSLISDSHNITPNVPSIPDIIITEDKVRAKIMQLDIN